LVNPSTKASIYAIPPSTGVINNNAFTWSNISGVTAGSYQAKVYQISNPSIHAYSPTFIINSGSQAKSITVNYPNGGETLTTGQSIGISWSSTNISPDPVSLELVQGSNTTAYQIIASPIQNQSPYSWTIPSNIPTGQYRIKIYRTNTTNGTIVDYSNNTFTITNTTVPSCITWASGIQPNSFEKKIAAEYLCSQGIIQNTQNANSNDQPIQRHDLAKILFKGLFGSGSSVTTPVDYAPTPFYDIQSTNYYSQFVKALYYLEYGNGVSVFTRDFAHFRPSEKIKRKDAVKAFVEAWNIPVNFNPVGASPFGDVPVNDPAYPWIKAAKDAGLVNGNSNGSFFPEQYITRSDAFIILWRMLTSTTISKPTPTANDFFFSNNVTSLTWNKSLSTANANFDSYVKNSFAIDGIVPLSFSHFYSAVSTELPGELYEKYNYDSSTIRYKMLPLGKGWSHSYNAYLLKIDGDTAGSLTDDRYIIHWADGSFASYKLTGSNTFISETIGSYDTLYINSGALEVKKKDQTRYRFTYVGNNKVFTLSQIIDRHGNVLNLQWSLQNNSPRLDRVVVSPIRYLQFYYNKAGENLITAVSAYTGSIVRTVYFSYSQDNTDLISYKDAKNQSTTYNYGTGEKEKHLLKTITLPRGNVITNTYHQRKLASTQYNSQYKTDIDFTANYGTNNPTTKTKVTIYNSPAGTSNPHQSRYTYDKFGNVTDYASALDSTHIDYNIAGQQNLPSSITDYVSGIQTTINYNGKGNITQIQRSAPGLPNQTFKAYYNSLNDIDSTTDAKGNTTTYSYTSGQLTQIKQPNNVTTTIVPNTNGTPASITNPSNIKTIYAYNQYGSITSAIVDNTGIKATASYDDASRLTDLVDPNNVLTKVTYDNNDNVLSVKEDANNTGYITSYDYDANGNNIKITPPLGQHTILDYDNNDLLTKENFGGYYKQYTYNNDGTPKTIRNKNGHTFNYSFYPSGNTHAGQLQSNGYADFNYDTRHNLRTIIHKGNNKTITIGYDAFNRPDSVSYNDVSNPKAIKYYYNSNNLDSAIVYPTSINLTVYYTYDANNRLITVKDNNNYTYVTYTYLADGRLAIETFGNGTKSIYQYENNTGRLDSMASLTSSNAVIVGYKFIKDNAGNHENEIPNIPNGLTTSPPNTVNIIYQHSSIDRQTKFDTLNQGFNANGAQTTLNGQSWASYDELDNLTSYKRGSITDTFEYDGTEGRRRKNNTRYVLDILHNNNVLAETDLNGNDSSIYIYGIGLVCRIDPGTPTNKSYYHYDYRGGTIAITNSSQTVTHRYKYSAYGILEAKQESGFKNPYRYVGKYGVQYDDSALYFMRARYYNPYQGRFLSEDPIWYTNLFAYAGNNPIMNIDPSGENWLSDKGDAVVKALLSSPTVNYAADGIAGWSALINGEYELANEYFDKSNKNFVPAVKEIVTEAAISYATAGGYKLLRAGRYVLKPLGLGSTGRTVARNLTERLAMEEIVSNPSSGKVIEHTLKDARWFGWSKMSNKKAHGVEIHYNALWENGVIKAIDDFKFIDIIK